jgi:DNA-binding ferritin-like protein (Dps family)
VLLLASAVVAPSVGAYTEAVRTGTAWGDPITVQDYNNLAGVKCKYENNPGKKHDELDKIRIRPQFFHGPYDEKSYVGYRIIIKRNKPPLGDGTYKKFIVSKIIKKLASDSDIANFKARVFKVPEGTNARYRAHIKLYWYAKGSKTDVRGMTRGILDVYDHKMKPKPVYKVGSEGAAGYCNRNWHNGAP